MVIVIFIIIIIILLIWDFFKPTLAMASHWSLGDLKSPQVSRTLRSILAALNNAVVWMVPHSSSYFQVLLSKYQYFGDCTKSTSYNWYNPYFHVQQFLFFFQFLSKVQVPIFLFAFFQFYFAVIQDSKALIRWSASI